VANKSDNPLAQNTVRQLERMLSQRNPAMPTARIISIISIIAITGAGIPKLLDDVQRSAHERAGTSAANDDGQRVRRVLAETLTGRVRSLVLTMDDPALEGICHRGQREGLGIDAAPCELLHEISCIAGKHTASELG
jgi:putative protein kinase ArgK-like GTPase of G3E family